MRSNSAFLLRRWRFAPWLAGIVLAPLLFGSVTLTGQAIVAILFGISLLVLADEMGGWSVTQVPVVWRWAALGCLVLPLIPLPNGIVGLISPERLALAERFPIDAGSPGAWLPITMSWAGSAERLWELALVVMAFVLARHASRDPRMPRLLALTLAATVAAMAASDLWFRANGKLTVFGLWTNEWGTGAGTFPNRNHFANWIYVAALFASGLLLRNLAPLQSTRERQPRSRRLIETILVTMGLSAGLVMAVLSASRGALIAFGIGCATWIALLARRSRSRGRWLLTSLGAVTALVLVLAFAEPVVKRFRENADASSGHKIEFWRDSLAVLQKFPVTGTGVGTFVHAFNHYKPGGGDWTLWHAENEYVELAVETGIIGALVFGTLLIVPFLGWIRHALRSQLSEPDLTIGALAALAAFAAHALIDFPFQIPATAILAATLAGFLAGQRDLSAKPTLAPLPDRRRVVLNLSVALVVAVIAISQLAAEYSWNRAQAAQSDSERLNSLERSLGFWPFSSDRRIAIARIRAAMMDGMVPYQRNTAFSETRTRLNRGIALDPFNWQLRLERAWFDIAFAPDRALGIAEAFEVGRLNPLQAQIPLRFARHFVSRDPELAQRFVASAQLSRGADIQEALEIAFESSGDADALWRFVPANTNGLLGLGDFALKKGLQPLAAQAFQRLTGKVDSNVVADRLRKANRPDLADEALRGAPSAR